MRTSLTVCRPGGRTSASATSPPALRFGSVLATIRCGGVSSLLATMPRPRLPRLWRRRRNPASCAGSRPHPCGCPCAPRRRAPRSNGHRVVRSTGVMMVFVSVAVGAHETFCSRAAV
eukprot:31198-Pelagococcus_subviridis.AAC.48